MSDFNIFHGLFTDLFSASGTVNENIAIEAGCWYLCTDTAELFLGTYEDCANCANCTNCTNCADCHDRKLTLKKVNSTKLDQVAACIVKLDITNGNLIATYSDDTVVDLGKVVDYIPVNVSSFVNDAGYITAAEVPEADLSDYAKLEDIPTDYLTSIPDEYITESELNAKGYLTEHQPLTGLATEAYVDDAIAAIPEVDLTAYAKIADIPDVSEFITSIPDEYITESELDDLNYATEQYVIDAIAAQVPVDNLAKKEAVEEVKTKLETEVLPTINTTILPVVQAAATQDWVKEQGYLTEHQDLSEYAKKTELFSKSYKDLIDTPEIPSIDGLASEEYVENAIADIDLPIIDLSNYALKSELRAKADDVPFTRSKLVTNAIGNFLAGDDVKGLTVAEIFAKLLGLADGAEPEGTVEEIVAYRLPMYSVTSDGILAEVPFNYLKLNVETAADEPTELGFYQIIDQSGTIIESGYQEIQINSDSVYYVIALPKAVDYNTMVTLQSYNPMENLWAEIEKFSMTSDPAEVTALCEEANIDISRIDTDVYTIWASDICPDGSPLRYIITEEVI